MVVVADGVNSAFRAAFADELEPVVELRANRFVWLGTTFPFEAFTFYFNQHEHGLFQVHAYRYESGEGASRSTFIVECSEETFRRSGLSETDEHATAR